MSTGRFYPTPPSAIICLTTRPVDCEHLSLTLGASVIVSYLLRRRAAAAMKILHAARPNSTH